VSNLGNQDDWAVVPSRGAIGNARLRAELVELAQLGLDAVDATGCVIAYGDRLEQGLVQAPLAPPPWADLEAAILKLKPAHSALSAGNKFAILRIEAADFVSNQKNAALFANRFKLLAAMATDDSAWTAVGLLLDFRRDGTALEAQLKLLSRLAMAIVARAVHVASRDFWRERAMSTAAGAASAKQTTSAIETDRRWVEQALRKVTRLEPRRRLEGFGETAAELGRCDAWIIALIDNNVLTVERYFGLQAVPPLDHGSALAESFRRQSVIVRESPGQRTKIYREDRLFADAGFAAYLCAPLQTGAIALAARKTIDWAARNRIEAFVNALAPTAKAWALEAELVRQRGLIRNLTLRLLSAGDLERARISRDLHDDHAQLLSAARIALSARRGDATKLLEELEKRLRTRLLALRPPALGRHSLEQAIAFELRRLEAAGIGARFVAPEGVAPLARPIEQVCYQIVREAVSNIIRHAGAGQVEVGLERTGKCAKLTISDDGRGVGKNQGGAGLRGLAERVELLGGRCSLESRPGLTRLVAEIPEFGQ